MENNENRYFLKSQWNNDSMKGTDQAKEIPMPSYEKSFNKDGLISLPDPLKTELKKRDIVEIITDRKSRRKLGEGNVSLSELSFVLWATQGIREVISGKMFKNVPSAGSRHPFNTYVYADKVEGLKKGIYCYIASENALMEVNTGEDENLKERLLKALRGQLFNCGFSLLWAYVPYRCEWRYTNNSYRVSAYDAGHICQNAYLAAEALGLGCCAIGAYNQEEVDSVLGLCGKEEYTAYIGVFGRYN